MIAQIGKWFYSSDALKQEIEIKEGCIKKALEEVEKKRLELRNALWWVAELEFEKANPGQTLPWSESVLPPIMNT